jgi:hypothetical protein
MQKSFPTDHADEPRNSVTGVPNAVDEAGI